MRFKNIYAYLLAFLIILPIGAFAQDKAIDEKWGKPVFVYGSGLNDKEIAETAKLLGLSNLENVNSKVVDGSDEIKYLGSGAGDSSSMISSVLVTKKDKGFGVKVEVKTPDKISQIKAIQYSNAAITAGISDCLIEVASVKLVTGESALTGVYKAYDASGETLNVERMKVAQKELETTNKIAQENKDNSKFDLNAFNNIIINVKQEIANYYQDSGKKADREEIENFINTSIEKYQLQDVINSDQVSRLTELFNEYQNTGAVDSKEVITQLKGLADTLGDRAGKIYNDAKEAGILDKIGGFFRMIIDAIMKIIDKR